MQESAPVIAYVALGANLGDRAANIRAALEALNGAPGTRVRRVSSLLENPAVGGPADSPPFLNGVAEVETLLPAEDLLRELLEIERTLGRDRRAKWEPRPIDLDLILYGDRVIDAPSLQVPHPLMQERRFVLEPLAEIAPQAVHPVSELTVGEMLADLDEPEAEDDAPPEPGIIPRDVRCVGCGYNLRGLPIRHTCPECGRPTTDSIDPERYESAPGGNPYRDDPRLEQAAAALATDIGYAPQAVLMVHDAMHDASHTAEFAEREGLSLDTSRDASARDVVNAFAERARECFWDDGPAAAEALIGWGIKDSRDVGRIAFAMVEAGWFEASESDRLEDFDGLFVTSALFNAPPPGREPRQSS
jgi:2-amino-4-hydroxy-6-hydroxymethyldihydropteridine diphosphokinase